MKLSFSTVTRCCAGVSAGLLLLGLCGCGAPPTKIPAGFSAYSAPDNHFTCQGPDNWERSQFGGASLVSGIVFKSGASRIDITSDLQGALMGDIAKAGNAQLENVTGMLPDNMQVNMPAPTPPVEKLHLAGKRELEKKYKEYDELPMNTFQTAMGEGRVSEWTGETGGFPNIKMHGLRATILGGERRITIVCISPEKDYKSLAEPFRKVILSLMPGGG